MNNLHEDREESTETGSHVRVVGLRGGTDPKVQPVDIGKPATVVGFWVTLTMEEDGSYEAHINEDYVANRAREEKFSYFISDGSETAEQVIRFPIKPFKGFDWVQHQAVKNRKAVLEMKSQISEATGLPLEAIGRVEDWGDRFNAHLPDGMRFVSKATAA